MRQILFGAALLLVLCGEAFGNTGVFSGSGHSLQLAKTADVQMISEDVLITPTVGTSATELTAKFRCKFALKNRSDKPVTIQVGFPLDRELEGQPPAPTSDEARVGSYHFTARDAEQTYHVRYVSSDPKDKLAHVFLWDISFAAGEQKELHVGYILPMSVGMASTRKDEAPRVGFNLPTEERPWRSRIECCVVLYVDYVTETGRSWVGPIEKARFRYVNAEFERDLRKQVTSAVERELEEQPAVETSDDNTFGDSGSMMGGPDCVPGMKLGTVVPLITPGGWKPASLSDIRPSQPGPDHKPGGIEWNFDNFKPGAPFVFAYYLVGFPEKPEDCERWVRSVLGKEPKKSDVLELREIAAALFGVAPRTAPVRNIVEQQVWYSPHSNIVEARLSESQKAVLARLGKIADACKVAAKPPSSLPKSLVNETGLCDNLRGHTEQVIQVAFSPDGKTIASASCDQTVRLWQPATGKCTAILTGHSNAVTAIAFSRDSRLLASADWTGSILLWDLAKRKNLGALSGHTDRVESVAFSPDGKSLASASMDTTVKLWDVAALKCVATFAHDTNLRSLAFSPDGRIIASAGYDNLVHLWDVAGRKRIGALKGHKDCIFAVAFFPDGKTLASASGDGTIRLWDVAEARCMATLQYGGVILSVAFSNDGKTLATGGQGPKIVLWDVASRRQFATLGANVAFVTAVSFAPDGKTIASSGDFGDSRDNTVKLWNVSRAEPAK